MIAKARQAAAIAGAAMLAIAGLAPCPAAESSLAAAIDPAWATAPVWNDGLREFAVFDGQRVVDGRPVAFRCTIVTGREDFTREYWTRADWPHGDKPIVPVLVQLQSAGVPDAGFADDWSAMLAFERTPAVRLAKMVVLASESAVPSFKEFQLWHETPKMRFSSPRDGEGSGERALPDHGPDVRFEEELPLLLRMLRFDDGLQARFALEPSQRTADAPVPVPSAAILTVVRPSGDVSTAIGRFPADAAWLVVVETRDGRALDFLVESAPPNRLLGWSHSDGRRFETRSVERRRQ